MAVVLPGPAIDTLPPLGVVSVTVLLLVASARSTLAGTPGRESNTGVNSSDVPLVASALLLDPKWLLVVAAINAYVIALPPVRWTRLLFNASVATLSCLAGAAVWLAVLPAGEAEQLLQDPWRVVAAGLLCSVTFHYVGIVLVSVMVSVAHGEPVRRSPLLSLRHAVNETAGAALGAVAALLTSLAVPLLLLLAPALALLSRPVELESAQRESRTDPLTGVGNVAFFREAADREIARAERFGHDLAVLMLDMDHLREVNNTHGHAVGDVALQALSQRISSVLRPYDVFARLGGEEFALLMPDTSLEEATVVAERLREAVAGDPVQASGMAEGLSISVSGGLARRQPSESIEDALRRADALLYEAKAAGRNCVRVAQ